MLHEWCAEDEQINSDPAGDFRPDALPATSVPINPGLGLAPKYTV